MLSENSVAFERSTRDGLKKWELSEEERNKYEKVIKGVPKVVDKNKTPIAVGHLLHNEPNLYDPILVC